MRRALLLLSAVLALAGAGCSSLEDIDQDQAKDALTQAWDAVQDYLGGSGE